MGNTGIITRTALSDETTCVITKTVLADDTKSSNNYQKPIETLYNAPLRYLVKSKDDDTTEDDDYLPENDGSLSDDHTITSEEVK